MSMVPMLRIDCLHSWFDLSDPAAEDKLYDSEARRYFVTRVTRTSFPWRSARSSASE